jgi:bifunctional non-homologous end joining protein LigD
MVKVELPDKITPHQAGQYILSPDFCVQEKRNGKHRLIVRDGNALSCYNRDAEQVGVDKKFGFLLDTKLPLQYAIDVEVESREVYILDVLLSKNISVVGLPYKDRLAEALMTFDGRVGGLSVVESTFGTEDKMERCQQLAKANAEGVVFKDLTAAYREGRREQHHALKFWKTLDAVVIGPSAKGHDSVDLGLFANGQIKRICGSSLIGKGIIASGDVVEIKYLYGTRERHAVQPTILRKRDDKPAVRCTMDQLVINRDMAE